MLTTTEAPVHAEAAALTAARTFGAALKASPEFVALLAADQAIAADPQAEAAIAAFDRLQQQLRTEITTRTLQESQRAELNQCQQAMYAVPSVAAYVSATEAFQAVCRETASIVSTEIGIDFAANSRSGGCCG
ncbi:MAG: YlbF family regulator [Propionicimonas sp.]|nr:YlbF family regulator [Propionicimonas sp.]